MKLHVILFAFLMIVPFSVGAEQTPAAVPEYLLDVSFDIPQSRIIGTALLNVQSGQEISFYTGDLSIKEVLLNGQKADFTVQERVLKMKPLQRGELVIRYEGIFKDDKAVSTTNYGVTESVVSEKGISLTGLWYPQMNCLCRYRLKALLPAGYQAISEAERIEKRPGSGGIEYTFDFPYPVDGINLVAANRYEEMRDTFNAIELYAYFFTEDRELAKTYLASTKNYLQQYERLIGPYPYKRFSIIENFLPTGYSMPTYTLLGQDVVRLPFIVETSLGHEILHQWFGNHVYIDYEKGNWAEGLTTYLADHRFEDQKGKGWEYRKQLLIDYESYVNSKNEFALKDFRGRTDYASKAIGYGKAAMVFHMLKHMAGEDAFIASLRELIKERRFQKASWGDIRAVFEKQYKKDLECFFKQWLDNAGLPFMSSGRLTVKQSGDTYEAAVGISQRESVYTLDVPLTISFPDGSVKKQTVLVDKAKNTVTQQVDRMPEKIAIDGDYDIARHLDEDELPPVIARILGEEQPIIVPAKDDEATYRSVVAAFKERGAVEKKAEELKDSDIKNATLIVLGKNNPLLKRLFSTTAADPGFTLMVKENPWNPRKVIGIINAPSQEEADAAYRKIFHYGKYSTLSFEKGKNTVKSVEESQRGLALWKKEKTMAVDVAALTTVPGVIESVSNKKIVYVGEFHNRFEHHAIQLEVIKGLFAKNKKIAIGMEMFQRPFQKTLDAFIAGTIDEREFLKKTEYFKRWSFDYNLYKPILSFARAEKIPVIALNMEREIIEKVSSGGIDALSDEEKKEIPQSMDFSDELYRERLKAVFQGHGHGTLKNRDFTFFYQSQILWDETMAESINAFFRNNPDYQASGQMVVIAGGGHIAYGAGIPQRVYRRNGYSYAIILNDGEMEKGIADYIAFPEQVEAVAAPKIMASLQEEKGTVSIAEFPEQSVSKEAGLKVGDILLALDDMPVQSIEDVKIHLFYKKRGESLRVKVMRKRFLFGDKVMEFTVTL